MAGAMAALKHPIAAGSHLARAMQGGGVARPQPGMLTPAQQQLPTVIKNILGIGQGAVLFPGTAAAEEKPSDISLSTRFSVKNGQIYNAGVPISRETLQHYIQRQEKAMADNKKQGPSGEAANQSMMPELNSAKKALDSLPKQ